MKSHIIGFLLVTLAQIPMPIKIGTTFQNKLLPNVQITGDHASAFVNQGSSCFKLRCNTFGCFALAILEDTIAFVLCLI